ncbi:Rieske (2Fe-2S) protein [Marinobacterium weihaiense]|uniref:Rieske (2Fe-2S) protein n=1 Tax=Marinobacterium weihaiense TaxID=2851016 RepID=A0ABS6MEB5_9GAMM|nr:Rieske (2Fe-2S) protein [Marinobacterium weihaiense]MBV0934204.1 Rieske (2Fe-2S) protein [Marinobacterium weihaiense]
MPNIRLCHVDELDPVEGQSFELADGSAVVVFKRGARVLAWHNNCPHRGIRLEWQPNQFLDDEKQFIQCATHGALFGVEDGVCVAGPCPGEQLSPLPCRVEQGVVYLQQNRS